MGHTITIRLKPEQAEWLAATAKRTGVPQGKIIRDQLEKAMARKKQGFLSLAGAVGDRPRDLSTRRGFSRS